MSTIVRITINKKLASVLEILRNKFPALDDSEIFKLTLSDYVSTKVFIDEDKTNPKPQTTFDTTFKTFTKKSVNLSALTKSMKFKRSLVLPQGQSYKDVYYNDMEEKHLNGNI